MPIPDNIGSSSSVPALVNIGNYTVSADSIGSTSEPDEFGYPTVHSVWYYMSSPSNQTTVVASVTGDFVVILDYDITPDVQYFSVTAKDAASIEQGSGAPGAPWTINIENGQRIYFRVFGSGSQEGNFTLHFNVSVPEGTDNAIDLRKISFRAYQISGGE